MQKVLSSGKKVRDRSAQRKRLRRLRSLKERLQESEHFYSDIGEEQRREGPEIFENTSPTEQVNDDGVDQQDSPESFSLRSPFEFDEFQLLDED